MKEILFGAAYYDEYMPCERLAEDVRSTDYTDSQSLVELHSSVKSVPK